jgi:hypothetical protein
MFIVMWRNERIKSFNVLKDAMDYREQYIKLYNVRGTDAKYYTIQKLY